MTPEQLKASILQYAIQGKLVEQRPEEGTGEELYRQIQAEKQRLIKAGKIKKEKALPEITEDEIPFDIPKTWCWIRLGELIRVIGGVSYKKGDVIKNGIRILRGGNIQSMKVLTDEDDVFLPHEYRDDEKQVKIGDILIVASTGSKAVIGKAGYVDREMPCTMIGAFLRICRPIYFETVEYLRCLFDSDFYRKHIRDLSQGTNINNVKESYITEFVIPFPPLTEQKRIVAKIEELLPYVDRYADAYEKLEQFNAKFPEDMKKSILQYAIQGKLVEQRPEEGTGEELYRQIQKEKQLLIKEGKLKKTRALPTIMDEEVPYDFPASWKVCYIDDIAFVTKLAGFEYTKYIADNLVPTGIPLFKGKNVQNGKLVLSFESYIPENVSDELPRSQITKKCLLTPYVGTIGNIAVFDGSFKAHLGSNVGKIELLNPDTQTFILEEYVLWYLKSTYGYAELTKYKKATAQESISIDAIRNVVIAIPPLEEQRRIVAKIEELLPYCDKLK